MKTILFSTLLFLSFNLFAQDPTLKETQDWIKEKIESNGLRAYHMETYYEVLYSDSGDLIIKQTAWFTIREQSTIDVYTIPIKKMDKIKYQMNDMDVTLKIRCRKSESAQILCETYEKDVIVETKNIDDFTIVMGKNFKNYDLTNRLIKAVNHLIELNGGEVVKEVF